MSGAALGELEQLVLLAVLRIEGDAYAASVRAELAQRTQRDVARGAVHVTLDRLERKGYLRSTTAAGDGPRAGRARRIFTLTAAGSRALQETLGALHAMTQGLHGRLGLSTS